MKKLTDGSLIIQAAVDGPFEPIRSVSSDPLLIQQIQHGRPQSLSHAEKQDKLKVLIREMRQSKPGLTFAQAWEKLYKSNPDLFDAPR